MNHQIKNLFEFTNEYNKSVIKPEEFWAKSLKVFNGGKSGKKY